MEDRDNNVLELRGESLGTITNQSSLEEVFQNKTLRPILKLQNDLFIQVFINYAMKQKNVFFTLTPEKKMAYVENVIQRDIKFRNSLKGMVIAFFTLDEYAEYIQNSSNLNKRMMNMLIERLKSQIQLITVEA
ncbi:glyoxalase [Flavobacterium sp. IMCC34852]|uniref:Glyoxalase n=1 Tax=Flavobacterium rivulicola TaxID=2732161 RepID=A0A7Y3VZT7_9FLAO|nr:glyoxalase [Flavobacterium sp. IMCC34852]NNT73155.1 glyoxalase [Flavobacterium sp. IMCC34852]